MKKPLITITHPVTKETKTIAEWAKILEMKETNFRNKYHRYKKDEISIEDLFSSKKVDPVKKYKRQQKRFSNKKSYVFRPEYFDYPRNTSLIGWEAFDPAISLETPVMSGITQSVDGKGFFHNPYPFGVFPTKNELVREYLRLRYEVYNNDLEEMFLDLVK